MSVEEVASSLHLSVREVIRMADQRILPAVKVRGQWRFRAGEVWNWMEVNLSTLPGRREKDRHPRPAARMLISPVLQEAGIAVEVAARTRPSVLGELAALAETVDSTLDRRILLAALQAREAQSTTALQDGVAVPHPATPLYTQGPLIAAVRTIRGIAFGERGGGLTDLFFLVCCPEQRDHLLYLGRLCRLLIERPLRTELRSAPDAAAFRRAIQQGESSICDPERS